MPPKGEDWTGADPGFGFTGGGTHKNDEEKIQQFLKSGERSELDFFKNIFRR